MNRRSALRLQGALLAILFLSSAAAADSIQITLTHVSQTGAAGTTITYDATLTNLTGSTVFLNGESSSTAASFLTVDNNTFVSNAPLSLAPGASSGTLALFNVLIAPGTLAGAYGLNTFSILGGIDSSSLNPVGSAQFGVTVSPVPEPGTIILLATGMLGLGAWGRLRRRTRPRV